ncbi:site-specific DNA-methyltransferase [Candidatus Uhrbacteria bacterium]|nr:site-specific DNA-methyltransferase [Candidatus Uhrbacteria bacterium]
MATLQFKGKSAVWNHHLSVPYHTLEKNEKLSLKGKSQDENVIIQGDNLRALKALLPQYQGRIKCIYIDPPYNTGNEGWKYNDNVNSPTIRDWLGDAVGKDDLLRHDKWLCMMTPRLKLLRDLLAEDGVIFISIDDNEVHNLRLLMDEVFGSKNFIACIVAQLNPRGRTLDKFLAKTYEYVLLYAKNEDKDTSVNQIEKQGELLNTYNKQDAKGIYRELELRNRNPVFNRANRPNLYYPFYVDAATSKVSLDKSKNLVEVFPRNSSDVDGCWTWGKDKAAKQIDELIGKQVSTGAWRVYRKDYLEGESGDVASTKAKALWLEKGINNENGKEMCNELFGTCPFDFPKSVDLIKRCLQLGTGKNDLVLDSFAGSGTTAQAVLDLNKEDGGNRKFILVEMEEYANDITAQRVRLASKKYGYDEGFIYATLGSAIDAEALLSGNLPSYTELAKYVYYLATGKNQSKESVIKEQTAFVGSGDGVSIYLHYKNDMNTLKSLAITLDWAQKTHEKDGGKKIVYAPACYLDDESLEKYNIKFVSIPYNLFERNA